MAMKIQTSNNVPDSAYFRTRDAEPRIEENTLILLDGRGTFRSSWGAPGVTSTVVLETPMLVVIHVGFYHRHGGGQFWRYYRQGEKQIERLPSWKSLREDERLLVLAGWIERAPGWAKCPGKLRSQYIRPGELKRIETGEDGAPIGYKWLRKDREGTLHSPFAYSHPVWIGGQLTADRAPTMKNTSGIYAAKNVRDPNLRAYRRPGLILVQIRLSGTVVEHDRGFRAEIADVLAVMEETDGNR